MKIAVIGRKGLGGVIMRGEDVARVNEWEFIDLYKLPPGKHFDALLLVKYHKGIANQIRSACDRLIFDPLDCWESDGPDSAPGDFWNRQYLNLLFDDVLATSPAAAECIATSLPNCRVHGMPHHSDPQLSRDWYDPSGPVVYAGGKRFIERHLTAIEQACRKIGRQFVINFGRRPVPTLRGAALHLHPRFPNTDSPLNRLCKPQVKLANAAAAGCPILATPHPCYSSMNAGGCHIDHHDNWERLILRALESQPPTRQPTLAEHAQEIRRILG